MKKTDSVSSGSSIGTLVTRQKVADISLNEIDAAKIKIGQKATVEFDAIEDLSVSGKVIEIDLVGTVDQGVVTYNVKIGFDTQDDRVKPGMSVSVAIVTDVKTETLVAPNSAVKSQNNFYYVEVFDQKFSRDQISQGIMTQTPPRRQPIEVGISNDNLTEIISGLNEGDQIVARTVNFNSAQKQTQTGQQSGSVRIPGLPSGTRR